MSKEVKRYFVEGPDWELIEDDIGELVEYEDYDALRTELEIFTRSVMRREAKLTAENESLRKDAERYRWTKGCDPEEIDIVIENPGDDLDSVIDNAMQQS